MSRPRWPWGSITDGIMLKPYDPELVEQIRAASEVMRTEKNVLRALSES